MEKKKCRHLYVWLNAHFLPHSNLQYSFNSWTFNNETEMLRIHTAEYRCCEYLSIFMCFFSQFDYLVLSLSSLFTNWKCFYKHLSAFADTDQQNSEI